MKDIPADIINRASRGDEAAFEEIYRAASGFVYSVALRVLGNESEAEDLTQELFIALYRKLKSFLFRSSFKTWLYRMAMNMTLNAYNRRARETGRRADYDKAEAVAAVGASQPDEAGRQDSEKVVKELLEGLSPEHRSCIVLREIEGLSYDEIAVALNININTVRSRLKRAREALISRARERGDRP